MNYDLSLAVDKWPVRAQDYFLFRRAGARRARVLKGLGCRLTFFLGAGGSDAGSGLTRADALSDFFGLLGKTASIGVTMRIRRSNVVRRGLADFWMGTALGRRFLPAGLEGLRLSRGMTIRSSGTVNKKLCIGFQCGLHGARSNSVDLAPWVDRKPTWRSDSYARRRPCAKTLSAQPDCQAD